MTPITGDSYVAVGYTVQLFNQTEGGTWTSSNTAIATIGASTGLVTGMSVGNSIITYTGLDTSTVTFTMNVLAIQVSNGFNVPRLFNAMIGRIGWNQPTRSDMPVIDNQNLASTSGRFWTEGHELVSINNIYKSQEDSQITAANFNEYLRQMDRSSLLRCVNAIFTKPALVEHRLCFQRRGYQQNVLIPKTQNGAFCGYRITVGAGDYAVVFNTISLFFNGVATFNLYLFNDLLDAPLKTKSVTTVANSQTKVQLDWAVNYVSNMTNGGIIYIGYFDTDLPDGVQAIDEQLNLWENAIVWNGTPFRSDKIDGVQNFNRRYVGTVFYSYGLNCEMSSYRDYTQVIVENPQLFDDARLLQYAMIALSLIKNSTRSGSDQLALKQMKDLLEEEVNGRLPTESTPFVSGLKQRYAKALQSISESFTAKIEAKSFCISGGHSDPYGYYQGFDIDNMPARQTLT